MPAADSVFNLASKLKTTDDVGIKKKCKFKENLNL
jgi:hypothetical protein